MTTQDHGLARRMWHQLEPLHAVFYYAPEVSEEAAALGYDVSTRWPAYFAWRLAPLGAAGTRQAAAACYSFSPRMVAEHVPAAWSVASSAGGCCHSAGGCGRAAGQLRPATAARPVSIVRAAPSSAGGASRTSRSTPTWANSAARAGVIRPRGVTLISSGPSPAGRPARLAASARPATDAAAWAGVSQ